MEPIVQYKLLIFLCTTCDISITYYYFFLNKKKNAFDIRDEKGPIGSFLFKYLGFSPIAMVAQALIILLWLNILMFLNDRFSSAPSEMYFIIIGIYGIVLWFNFIQVSTILQNWANERYWQLRREISKVKI